ncbi:MAG TPA: hypothetical protein VJ864_01260 [Candidatus Binatia bacterium]|nr:hypothetical protein [Candidatus Binatia bacterium]
MSRWKKLLIAFGVLLLLSQIPFACRRYKLGQLNATIQQVNSERVAAVDSLVEYKGVVHVHSFLGGHSKGGFREIISAAQANKLDFVVMTEHALAEYDTALMTLKGSHAGVLFINGNEINTGFGRLLIIPGDELEMLGGFNTIEQIERRPERNLLRVVAYPGEFKAWRDSAYEGVEVYNVYTNARDINPVVMFFDGLWSYRSYPHLLFANFYRRPSADLERWDQAIAGTGRKLVALAGNDAHANIGFELSDSTGEKLLGLNLDPYERSFRLVRIHVVSQRADDVSISPGPLMAAIAAGHCFIGFDIFGDTTGFRYAARDADESKIMGDEIKLDNEVRLNATMPVSGRIVLLKDGVMIQETTNTRSMEYVAKERGSYRVEAYLPQLGKQVGDQPWIISNPIYVR